MLDFNVPPTPCYLIDEQLLIKNLEKLKSVIDKTGCKILLAQKGFSMYKTYPLIAKYLNGTTASSLFEAKLGYTEMGKETHIFAPAYLESEFDEIMNFCGHIVFNSFNQWNKYKAVVTKSSKPIKCGIRVNPEYSQISPDIYNPCCENSRLGVTLAGFREKDLDGISGLHFHTMCEQNSDVLWQTVQVFDEKFGKYLHKMEWVNFGGGHHITRSDYDIQTLINSINFIKSKYNVEVYLEPGEAIALNTGYLIATVLDIVENGMRIAILDASAACHMPDVLEMPYRPHIIGAGKPGEKEYQYKLAGNTCLAGDIIGDYSFDTPLNPGSRLVFCDMAHYTMVKNNTFNGINLPSIVLYEKEGTYNIVRQFGYDDFKSRL